MIGFLEPLVQAITFADQRDGGFLGPGFGRPMTAGSIGSASRSTRRFRRRRERRLGVRGDPSRVARGPGSTSLWRSPIGRDDWQPVAALTGTFSPVVPLLVASGHSVWDGVLPANATVASIPALWRSDDAAHWQRTAHPCASAIGDLLGITVTSATDLVMVCADGGTPDEIVTSTDGGIHTRKTAHTPPRANFEVVAAALGQLQTICSPFPTTPRSPPPRSRACQSELDRTSDGGQILDPHRLRPEWHRLGDLQFVSPTVAWAVHGYPGASADQLIHSTDTGASFTPVRF